MVEYVLLVAVIAGISLVAVRALSAGASDEVASQSVCVSQRPQPPSCSAAAVDVTSTTAAPVVSSSTTTTAPSAATTTTTAPPTTTTTAAPTTTTTTAAPTTTSTAAPAPSGAFSSTTGNCTSTTGNGRCNRWTASTSIRITRSGSPVNNAAVVVSLSTGDTATCTTTSNGSCTLQVTNLNWNSVGTVTFTLSTVNGAAPASTPATTATRP